MYLNLILTLSLLSSGLLRLGKAKGTCDHLQTNPPSTIFDLVSGCRSEALIGLERLYELAGCLFMEGNIIDGSNKLDFRALMSSLPPEMLNSPDFTDDYWQIVRDCFELYGEKPAETMRIVHQCIDDEVNGENNSDFIEN